jgi:hypothetical protein
LDNEKTPVADADQLKKNLRVKPDVYMAALLDEVNEHLVELIDRTGAGQRPPQNPLATKLYTTPETAITVATPVIPDSFDTISDPNTVPPTPGYQVHTIYETLKRISPKISVINDGSEIIYVVSSSDGNTWSPETTVLPGESWDFYNVYEVRLRSPIVGDPSTFSGGVYRITENSFRLAYSGFQPSVSASLAGPFLPIGNTGLTAITLLLFGKPANALLDTDIPLGAGATYLGATRDFRPSRLGFMSALTYSDVVSAANGFRIQQSNDGLVWLDLDAIITTAIPGGFGGRIKSAIAGRFARVAYTNGAGAQTFFSLGSRSTIS